MNAEETGKVLGLAALYDNRKVDAPVVMAWHQVIGDLTFADAEQAVRDHYGAVRERVMPADIRERVKEVRQGRLDRSPVPCPPPHVAADPDAYREWHRTWRKRIADGEWTAPEIDAVTRRAIEEARS